MSIASGTRLGQYEVQDFIGQGAMGLVYRAYHSQLERTGAVKVMQAITPDPDTVARFRHEAQAIAKLRHPNIVDVYDFGEFQGTPYMIVEYIPGGSLASRMAQGVLDRRTALKYLRGIAAGLDYAHSRGVVHRDVKPANVGTPAYMAPEQVTGGRVGPAADRYSLATIAYEMLTGVIPFDGEGLMELLYAQVHREPPSPSSRDRSLGRPADAVVMRGLAKDPAARWESATAFVEALASALDPEPAIGTTMVMAPRSTSTVPIAETAVVERVTSPSRPAVLTLAYPSPPPRPIENRRSRKPLIALTAAGLIIALLLAGVAYWAATHRPVTLSLSSTTVTAGDSVVVSADHVPPDQLGRIELWSARYTFPFLADARGHVNVTITVPVDIGAGDHQVKVCWNGACRAEQTLQVMERVASTSPTPSPSPSQSPSPSPSPSARPSPLASPAPIRSPSPIPSTAPGRSLALSSGHIQILIGNMTVKGFRFAPGRTVILTFVQESAPTTDKEVATGIVASDGTFFLNYTIPATAHVGIAYVKACDPIACAFASINVTAAS
ncbi:MAG: serine/threonine protein kinase [Chloroflexi bacterium]|nr:MAG: serine/threonine protein kinase [Chloroflexota bacterium]